jgi:hypothetical protein
VSLANTLKDKLELRWLQGLLAVIVGAVLAGVLSWSLHWQGHDGAAVAVIGVWTMAAAFAVGLFLIRLLLTPRSPIIAVARTVIDEAVRMRIAVVFIVAVAIVVPVLPMMLDPKELLHYRVQTFLTWSITLLGWLLALMTIFVSCATICRDVSQSIVYTTLTKPLSRWGYLLGKWLGIGLLNIWLLAVSGIGVYTFTAVLERMPIRVDDNRERVKHEVLTARAVVTPLPPAGMDLGKMVENELARLKRENPEDWQGPTREDDYDTIRQRLITRWHTLAPVIGPGSGEDSVKRFFFRGLGHLREAAVRAQSEAEAKGDSVDTTGRLLQLRIKPQAAKDTQNDQVNLLFVINDRPWPVRGGRPQLITINDNSFHMIHVPVNAIDEQGNLEVAILNRQVSPPTSISFAPGEGLELMYRVGGFEGNLARALVMIWIRLGFLSMFGLAAGTFLGFPTACMVGMFVLVIGTVGGFIQDALGYYGEAPGRDLEGWDRLMWYPLTIWTYVKTVKLWNIIKILIRLLGMLVVVVMVPAFGQSDPVALLAEGHFVSWTFLGKSALILGAVGTGATGLVGWLIWRKREVAIIP